MVQKRVRKNTRDVRAIKKFCFLLAVVFYDANIVRLMELMFKLKNVNTAVLYLYSALH